MQTRKLPVLGALGHAFRSTIDNIAFAFHISWPWIALLLPINIGANLYLASQGLNDPANLKAGSLLVVLPLFIVSFISAASIAVNWHRYVLLDEVAEGMQRLRIDSLTWRYIGNGLLIGLILAAGGIVAMIVASLFGWILSAILGKIAAVIIFPAVIAIYSMALVAAYRLSVKLPAVALGRTDFSLSNAWAATFGNFWQLLGLLLLFIICVILVLGAMFLATYILANFGVLGLSISLAAQVMINWIATILGVTLLTSLYGFFVEGRDF